MTSRKTTAPRSQEELEEIQAEGRDWFAEGYDFCESYVSAWREGKIALGKPIEEQPQGAYANKLWRSGFNQRMHEHLRSTMSRQGVAAGTAEVQRWRTGIAHALDPKAPH